MKTKVNPIAGETIKDLGAKLSNVFLNAQTETVHSGINPNEEKSQPVLSDEYLALSNKNANQLMRSGEMEIVKQKYPELYEVKIKELKEAGSDPSYFIK